MTVEQYIYDLDLDSHEKQIMVNQALNQATKYIKSCQRKDGAIVWFAEGKLDPWDHVEAMMGLTVSRDFSSVQQGFLWLHNNQNDDGSWFAKYFADENDEDKDRLKIEANFVAYIATGLWHYYLISQDLLFVQKIFPCVERAMDYVVSQQSLEGDIQWARSSIEHLPKDALITACASILRSMECAIYLGEVCGKQTARWETSYNLLAHALKSSPWRFDRTWESKDRFSMDWFYPILSGIYSAAESKLRLAKDWQKFVNEEYGCRCVSDEPWITVAESCELTIALVASEQRDKAEELFMKLLRWQDADGGFWTGYSFRDKAIWPLEKTSWTAAAIILAADAIYSITPASKLLTSNSGLIRL